jgi:outer membrane protein TolC
MDSADEFAPKQTLAHKVREFFRDLFGSKLIQRLEMDLLMARSDLQQLRQDKDEVIAELRSEKAQLMATVALYQVSINQRVGIDPTRKRPEKPSFANFNSPPAMSSWQKEVAEHDAQISKELAEEAAKAAKV